jgi:drug/metabolite transporter (DMT)-like permease
MSFISSISTSFERLPGPVKAGVWISLTGATFTGMMSIARHLSPELSIFVIVFFRSVFGLVFLSPVVMRRGPGILKTNKSKIFAIRGISAYLSLVLYFFAAIHIPLADIAAIGFTRPAFACIAAILILGELARTRRWIAMGIGLIGALIIVRPGFSEINEGIFYAFAAVGLTVCNTIFIKYLSRTEHPDTIALYQGLFVAPLAFLGALTVWQTPNFEQFLWLLLMGFFGALTQRTLARSFAAADATVVTVLDFLRLPIAAVIGLLLFNEWPVIWVWLGGAVIVASSFLLAKKEAADSKVNQE